MCKYYKKAYAFFNKKVKKMTPWDVSLLKTFSVLFGIIIGAYFSTFFKPYLKHLLIVFVIGWAVLAYRFLRE